MRLKNLIPTISIIVLFLLIITQLSLSIEKIHSYPTLPSYDSYYLLQCSEFISNTGNVPFNTPHTYFSTAINYPTSYTLLYSLLSDFTGITTESLYRYGGPLQFSFMLLCIYLLIRIYTNNAFFAVIGTLIYGSFPYNLYRSTMPLPEGLSLIFEVLIFFILLMKKLSLGPKLLLVALFLSGATYAHPRSIIVPIIVILLYIIISFKLNDFNKKSIKALIMCPSVYFISILPIIQFVINQYLYYVSPAQYSWSVLEPVITRYDILIFADYIEQFDFVPLILVFFGTGHFLFRSKKKPDNITIFAWFAFTLVLTQSIRFGFYAPPYRFFSFLMIPFTLIAIMGFVNFCAFLKKINSKQMIILMIFLMLTIVVVNYAENNVNNSVFFGFHQSDINAKEFLKKQITDSSVVVSYGTFSIHMGIPHSEGRYEVLHEILLSVDPKSLNNTLNRLYPTEDNIYFYLIATMDKPMKTKYPHFADILNNYQMIFDEKGTKIYKLR